MQLLILVYYFSPIFLPSRHTIHFGSFLASPVYIVALDADVVYFTLINTQFHE